jgi:uncharacterized protein (TIGR02466 family)
MNHTINLFPTVIYRNFYKHTEELKQNLFSKLEKVFEESKINNNEFMRNGTLCSYNSNTNLHLDFPEETSDVVSFVEQCSKAYWKSCGYYDKLEPFVFQMWANSTPTGGYVDSHLHGNMPFSAVLYVDASPEQGNLFIENPMEMVLMNQPIGPDVKYPLGEEISVSSGDLLIFPGYIRHSVKPNNTNKDRLILGFNLACKGTYWSSQWTVNK